ncbi:DUF6087 family protein [Streptomyces sp. NBC_00448]|uniref:DUF6087 family protein n=1 Tax=Streptomyces sp. NBC_00448 TaxID=2903652 RepID=UPI002E1B75EE
MDDEPLTEWAERRDAKIGRLRALPLLPGDGPRAGHVNPEAPRLIQRWNGHTWEPHAVAANLAEAKRILHPAAHEPPAQAPLPTPNPLRAGTGKHRKSQTPGPNER